MNKAQAIQSFWEGFGWATYDQNTVPEDAAMPRLTYNFVSGSFNETQVPPASLWDRTRSWKRITDKSDEIEAAIGMGGVMIPFDGGAIWIKRGSPFAQRVSDEDDSIRRILLNIELEYISQN